MNELEELRADNAQLRIIAGLVPHIEAGYYHELADNARLRAQLAAAFDALATVRALLAQGQPSAARLLLDDAVKGIAMDPPNEPNPLGDEEGDQYPE